MALPPVFFEHPSSVEHDPGPHPEQPGRIAAVSKELERLAWLGYTRRASPAVDHLVLTAVHSAVYVSAIERIAADGGGPLDPDTVISEGSYVAALHAAGGAVALVDHLLAGGPGTRGFSAHRPPGHHALRTRAMGFCVFNNIAVAARYALAHHGLKRVLVLDWDVHHGNGTNDVFYDSDELLFISIHEWPLYPGTGRLDDVGAGKGRGFTVNLPVPAGTGDADYLSLVGDLVVPLMHAFEPELVLVSAGYDAHFEDPLASCYVTEAGFAGMASMMSEACDEVGAPLGCVLEGGYHIQALVRSVIATMEALVGGSGEVATIESLVGGQDLIGRPSAPRPLALRGRERYAEFWPSLRSGVA
ncbi:MAG: histone deacetylase [Solirubrobacteraceae bacterium]